VKKPDTDSLRRKLYFYVFTSIVALFVLIVVSTNLAQKKYKEQEIQEYSNQIKSSLDHIVKHFFTTYKHRAERIVETTNLSEFLIQRDREAMYKMLKPKFDLMQKESPAFKVMHVHLSDGTSFLRVHQPSKFGDNIALQRMMLQEIHKLQEMISGYETGIYAAVYRVIQPVFSKDGTYIGALELGLDPSYIIEAIHEINGFDGMVFLKENQSVPYKLHSVLSPELQNIYHKYTLSQLLMQQEISVGRKEYKIHALDIQDFHGNEKVKLLFFQEVTTDALYFSYLQYLLYSFMLLVLLAFFWIMYKQISLYQRNIDKTYDEYLEGLHSNEQYLQAVFDVTPNIMITTTGGEIDNANNIMLEFFDYEDLASFKKDHECICELFIEAEGCLDAKIGNESWLEYILKRKTEIHHVCLEKNGQRYYFVVHAKNLAFDDVKRSVVVFNDITFQQLKHKAEQELVREISAKIALQEKLKNKDEIMIAQSRHAAMGEMISMIAHQWRQPISVIAMYANNILLDVELENIQSQKLKSEVSDIVLQTKHLSKTIDDFRNFFKPNRLKDSVLVSEVFNEALSVINKSLSISDIEVENFFQTETKLHIFSRELLQVYLNLLKNAAEALIEHKDTERKIINKIYETEDSVIIEICDNGGGISAAIEDKIFDPYFSTKDQKNGTGLGLYMSKTIIEKHLKGRLRVLNIGDGACFQIELAKNKEVGE